MLPLNDARAGPNWRFFVAILTADLMNINENVLLISEVRIYNIL